MTTILYTRLHYRGMAVFGKKYHPGIKILYDKGLISYSVKVKKYIIKNLSPPPRKPGKVKYVSEATMYRIASYLFHKNGQRKKGRPLTTPLSKMYGLQKQRYTYAQKQKRIKEATLFGMKETSSKTVKRKVKRNIKTYKKKPTLTKKEIPDFIFDTDVREWELTRSHETIFPFRAVIRLTNPDGSPKEHYTFKKPSEIPLKLGYVRDEVIIKKVLPLARLFKRKMGISKKYEFAGTLEFLIVEKGQQVRYGSKHGIPLRIVRTTAKDYDNVIVRVFTEDIAESLSRISNTQLNVFKSEKVFRMVALISISVYMMVDAKRAKELKKYIGRVGVYR